MELTEHLVSSFARGGISAFIDWLTEKDSEGFTMPGGKTLLPHIESIRYFARSTNEYPRPGSLDAWQQAASELGVTEAVGLREMVLRLLRGVDEWQIGTASHDYRGKTVAHTELGWVLVAEGEGDTSSARKAIKLLLEVFEAAKGLEPRNTPTAMATHFLQEKARALCGKGYKNLSGQELERFESQQNAEAALVFIEESEGTLDALWWVHGSCAAYHVTERGICQFGATEGDRFSLRTCFGRDRFTDIASYQTGKTILRPGEWLIVATKALESNLTYAEIARVIRAAPSAQVGAALLLEAVKYRMKLDDTRRSDCTIVVVRG